MTNEDERQQAQVEGAIDAIDGMMGVVDGLQDYVITSAGRERHGTRYRLNLLWIHSVAALLMAPLMILTGRKGLAGPSFNFLREIPGSPASVAVLLGLGGIILGMGVIFRAKRTEIVGLVILAMFYLIMSISFAIPATRWLLHMDKIKPPLYGPVLYLHITLIMGFHIWGLINVLRDERISRALLEGHHHAG